MRGQPSRCARPTAVRLRGRVKRVHEFPRESVPALRGMGASLAADGGPGAHRARKSWRMLGSLVLTALAMCRRPVSRIVYVRSRETISRVGARLRRLPDQYDIADDDPDVVNQARALYDAQGRLAGGGVNVRHPGGAPHGGAAAGHHQGEAAGARGDPPVRAVGEGVVQDEQGLAPRGGEPAGRALPPGDGSEPAHLRDPEVVVDAVRAGDAAGTPGTAEYDRDERFAVVVDSRAMSR